MLLLCRAKLLEISLNFLYHGGPVSEGQVYDGRGKGSSPN